MNNASVSPLQTVVSAAVAVLVVALGHLLTVSRDHHNRRQEQRIAYLVEAYRSFCQANHHPRLYEIADKVEQAVADVQLFGTPRQASLVRRFAIDLGTVQTAQLDDLLTELRDSLRSELGAEPLSDRIQWLRIGRQGERAPK